MSTIKRYHESLEVLTGPIWLMEELNGFTRWNSLIYIPLDPDNLPIIGLSVINDQTWDLTTIFTNPTTNQGLPLFIEGQQSWLYKIPYCYLEELDEPI